MNIYKDVIDDIGKLCRFFKRFIKPNKTISYTTVSSEPSIQLNKTRIDATLIPMGPPPVTWKPGDPITMKTGTTCSPFGAIGGINDISFKQWQKQQEFYEQQKHPNKFINAVDLEALIKEFKAKGKMQ